MHDENAPDDTPLLQDLIDVQAIQTLVESVTALTGIVCALLDLEGNVLVASGWQSICTLFHRRNPETAQRCRESDTTLAGQLEAGKGHTIYKCKNGLIDVAVPLVIDSRYVGNIFTGQFLFAPPDVEFFARQADEFGFDKESYLEALTRVPILTEERLEQTLRFLTDLTTLVGQMGADRKHLWDANRNLEENIARRTAKLEREIESRKKTEIKANMERSFSDALIRGLPGIAYLLDQHGRFIRWNENLLTVTGYSDAQVQTMSTLDFVAEEDSETVLLARERLSRAGKSSLEVRIRTIKGESIPYLLTGYNFVHNDMKYVVGLGIDISERVRTEREKEDLIHRLEASLAQVKKLSGFLPICANCKKVRDDDGYWNQIEKYLSEHSEAVFTHGLCPDCAQKLYPRGFYPSD